jgi:hypothetical protein
MTTLTPIRREDKPLHEAGKPNGEFRPQHTCSEPTAGSPHVGQCTIDVMRFENLVAAPLQRSLRGATHQLLDECGARPTDPNGRFRREGFGYAQPACIAFDQ